MIRPLIRSLHSPDLDRNTLPQDPQDCSILIEAEIGPHDGPGAEIFSFQVATAASLRRESLPRWGRGLLIVEEFSWKTVENAVQKLLMHAERPTWNEVAEELAKELHWEFERYSR